MEISQSYLNNIAILKELRPMADRVNYQATYKDDFEKIYEKATKADVKVDNAKDFLKSLSSDELTTLQKYDSLGDSININSLSNEGAYNLLMHDYEKYDFNNDGMIQDGAANTSGMIPSNADESTKKALVKSLNSMSDEDRMNVTGLFLMLPGDLQNAQSGQKSFNYDEVAKRVMNVLNPQPGAYSSAELKASVSRFWEEFKSKYYS